MDWVADLKKDIDNDKKMILTLTMLNPDISCFENIVDQDQAASQKPADQDTHCFLFCIKKKHEWSKYNI